MNTVRNTMTKTLSALAGSCFLIMILLICWQVFTRYILKDPSTWSEELVSYLFAWMSLFGACLVTGERGHMNIPLLVDMVPSRRRKALLILAELAAFLFSAVILFYGGLRITDLAMGQMTSSLGVPVGVFYAALPVAGVLNLIYTILNMAVIVQDRNEQEAI